MASDTVSNSDTSDGVVFQNVPIELTVIVGRARISVQELLALDKNTVLELDRTTNDPVIILAGEKVIAYGELQELSDSKDEALAVRITRVITDAKTS